MNTDQSFIARAREQIFGAQQRRAIQRAQEKRDAARGNAEIELFLDACIAEGLDPLKPRDMAIILRAAMMKFGHQPNEEGIGDWPDTEEGPFLD